MGGHTSWPRRDGGGKTRGQHGGVFREEANGKRLQGDVGTLQSRVDPKVFAIIRGGVAPCETGCHSIASFISAHPGPRARSPVHGRACRNRGAQNPVEVSVQGGGATVEAGRRHP